jgi:DNA-binding CsgD family transcriptional regulator
MGSEKTSQAIEPSIDADLNPRRSKFSRLNLAEQTAIRAMRSAGKNPTEIARALNRTAQTIRAYLAESARDIVHSNLEEYARLHLTAAGIAAAKGDSRPAEWAMERTKVVEPKAQATENKGLTVQIGVLLPNLGTSASLSLPAGDSAQVIDSEDVSD